MIVFAEIVGVSTFALFYIICLVWNISEIKKSTCITTVSVSLVLTVTLLIVSMPFGIILLTLLMLYRSMVYVVLKIKYGNKLVGLLSGEDALLSVDESSYIFCYLIVRCEKYTAEEFFDKIKTILGKAVACSKLNSILYASLGYFYMLKHTLDVDEFIKPMKTVDSAKERITKESFLELVNYYYNHLTVSNGHLPIRCVVGAQPVTWKDDAYDYYPIIIKCHHGLGDGITLIKLLTTLFANKKIISGKVVDTFKTKTLNEYKKQKSKDVEKSKVYAQMTQVFVGLKALMYTLILFPTFCVTTLRLKSINTANCQIPDVKVIATNEENAIEYVEKIKRIKQNFPGVAFPTIVMTAYTASLSEYYRKNYLPTTEFINACIPVTIGSQDILDPTSDETDVSKVTLRNSFSTIFLDLPLAIDHASEFSRLSSKPLTNRLMLINQKVQSTKHPAIHMVSYLLMRAFCTAIPYPTIRLMLKVMHFTTAISILPGPQKISYEDDSLLVTHFTPVNPIALGMDTSFVSLTYDGRLHMGLTVKSRFISDQKDVQSILDGVYRYIDMLEEECIDKL